MSLGNVVFWTLLIAVGVGLFRYLGPAGRSGLSPEQILAERFARGEIDAEEYQHRLDTLQR